MDVLFTLGMLGLMVAALIVLGWAWPRSPRGGGYRAGRGYGAGGGGRPGSPPDGSPPDAGPSVPEEDGVAWRWHDGPDHRDGPDAGDDSR